MTREEAIRAQIQTALDNEYAPCVPSPRRQEEIFRYATGGTKMNRGFRISFGLALAIVLALLTVTGALAAVLLSAREVVEQTAIPLARENDTDSLAVDTYTLDQLAELIRTANENGITLDETTGIMRALRSGEGYWEDEAVMEICRAAFGGVFYEWTIEEKHWYMEIERQMGHIPQDEENPYLLPGEGDMPVEEARALAVQLLLKEYPGAGDVDDPAVYRRIEFLEGENDGNGGPSGAFYSFEFQPRDMEHRAYYAVFGLHGEDPDTSEVPTILETGYNALELEEKIGDVYRARTGTRSSWSQEAWHRYRELLPDAKKDKSWSKACDGYLLSDYPLPDEGDLTAEQAREIAEKDAGAPAFHGEWEQVLLSHENKRIWKISFQYEIGDEAFPWTQWEIDAKTGDVLWKSKMEGSRWSCYVPHTVYDQLTEGQLTVQQAIALAADALRKELKDDTIPYEDESSYHVLCDFQERWGRWSLRFNSLRLDCGSAQVQISEPEHAVTILEAQPRQADGDSLYRRYQDVYGYGGWDQEIWVQFSKDMAALSPTGWEGRLLQMTVYPEESSAKITREQAVAIAAKVNDWPVAEATRATLVGGDQGPVWKIRLSGGACDWLYEIDGNSGSILSRVAYKGDNYDFDPPVEMYTLRRSFARAALREFGPEWAANIAACKEFADLSYDEPDMGFLNEEMYRADVAGSTVTFTALQPELFSVRVTLDQDGVPVFVEKQ